MTLIPSVFNLSLIPSVLSPLGDCSTRHQHPSFSVGSGQSRASNRGLLLTILILNCTTTENLTLNSQVFCPATGSAVFVLSPQWGMQCLFFPRNGECGVFSCPRNGECSVFCHRNGGCSVYFVPAMGGAVFISSRIFPADGAGSSSSIVTEELPNVFII